MPPPRKRQHPRSLESLFPRPKKPPVKRCAGGHRQGVDWKPARGCKTCDKERLRAELAKEPREPLPSPWPDGKCPAILTMRVVDSGRLIVHAIPRHLQRKRQRGRTRR